MDPVQSSEFAIDFPCGSFERDKIIPDTYTTVSVGTAIANDVGHAIGDTRSVTAIGDRRTVCRR
jgi:hypothetical protein